MYPLASFPCRLLCGGKSLGTRLLYPHVLVFAIIVCTLFGVDVDSKEKGGGREKF